MARSPYLIYLRGAGIKRRKVYYVAVWDREKHRYFRRSTGTDSPADAETMVRRWLAKDPEKRPDRLFPRRRKPFVIYLRTAGLKDGLYYAAFWSDSRHKYLRVSTKCRSRKKAEAFAESYARRYAGRPRKARRDPADKSGYVYFLIKDNPDGDHHLTKIGKSNNTQRPKNFSLPFRAQILYQATPDMHLSEIEWHSKFADRRVQSEWFALTAEDLAFVERSTRESA